MSHRDGELVVIENTEPDSCDLCGKIAELRPYGPNGENICFGCGMANEPVTQMKCDQILFGAPLPTVH